MPASEVNLRPSSSDLEKTVILAHRGDATAIDDLVQRLYPRVQRLVHRQLQLNFRRNNAWILSAFSTGDIVQEVFIRILTSSNQLPCADETTLVRYLATVVHNRLQDALRYHAADRRDVRRSVKPKDDEDRPIEQQAADKTPSEYAAVHEQLRIIEEVMQTLSSRQQAILRMRFEGRRTFPEIAGALAIPSADAARKAFVDAQALLLVRLGARGVKPNWPTK